MAARHCSTCGALRPPVAQSLEDAEEPTAPPAAPESSDMLTGLARLVRHAAAGELTPAEFADRMRVAASRLDEVFGGMAEELFALPDADEAYLQALETGLEDAASLFRIALAELEAFGEAADPARLRLGMRIAEKAEEGYQGMLAGVQADAAGHALRGEPDQFRRMAGEVLEGALPLEGYRLRVQEMQELVERAVGSATERLKEGFAAAREFDGVRTDPVERAAARMESAVQDLSHVILALHDPEAIRQAARRILDEA